jgi:hypothetical protein
MYHAMMIEQKFYPVQGGPACLHRDDGNTLCLFGLGRHRPSGSRSSPASAAGESPIASRIRPGEARSTTDVTNMHAHERRSQDVRARQCPSYVTPGPA